MSIWEIVITGEGAGGAVDAIFWGEDRRKFE
jgi:hypothetical protein